MPTHYSPKEAWERLLAGNERFAAQQASHANTDLDRRAQLRDGQNPIAVVLACSDSRVPVELIFDAGLGDLFVVRTAGEILGESVMGSISYAVNSLEVPLVIVLGHESCGAVAAARAAVDNGKIPDDHQRVLVERVAPSIMVAKSEGKTESYEFERRHAAQMAEQLAGTMPRLGQKLKDGSVGLVAARYLLSDSRVETIMSAGVGDTPKRSGSLATDGVLKSGV